MTLVWLKVLQPLWIFENIQSGCNSQVLCPVKNKQPHYPVISLWLSTVCFHTSFFLILTLQLPRTLLMHCLTKLSFTVKFFHRMNLLFHHLPFNFYYCYYFRLLFVLAKDYSRDWGHLLSGIDMEKPEVMLSSVTQETPRKPPQILSLFLPEHFTDASLSKSASQHNNFTIILYHKMLQKYF